VTAKAAQVRIYIDADVRGLGIVVGALRNDITYPGDPGALIHKRQRPPCPITNTTLLDIEWIPQVAARNWLIVTRDNEVFMTQWRRIEALIDVPGPFIVRASRTAMTRIPLD
jgi:hypothetical protein